MYGRGSPFSMPYHSIQSGEQLRLTLHERGAIPLYRPETDADHDASGDEQRRSGGEQELSTWSCTRGGGSGSGGGGAGYGGYGGASAPSSAWRVPAGKRESMWGVRVAGRPSERERRICPRSARIVAGTPQGRRPRLAARRARPTTTPRASPPPRDAADARAS